MVLLRRRHFHRVTLLRRIHRIGNVCAFREARTRLAERRQQHVHHESTRDAHHEKARGQEKALALSRTHDDDLRLGLLRREERAQRIVLRAIVGRSRLQRGVIGQARFDGLALIAVKLVVEPGRERLKVAIRRSFVVGHVRLTTFSDDARRPGSSPSRTRMCSRARERRDITVPAGTFKTTEASW